MLLVILCVISPLVLLWSKDTLLLGLFGGLAVGLITASIPFFISQSIKIKSINEYGFPFIKMERECLILYDDGMEFLYHNNTSSYRESMDVYRIPKENITAVKYDVRYSILTVIGEGELLAYDDYAEKRLNHKNSQRKFYSNSPYTIMMAFDNAKEIIETIKEMAKNTEEE